MAIAARRGRSNGIAAVLGFVLAAFLALDVMQLTKASALSAISCTKTLFNNTIDATLLVTQLSDAIVYQSKVYDLPSALTAAVIVDHQRQLTPFRAFTDCFGSALGADLSLGPAQIRMSTAAQLDGSVSTSMSAPMYRALRTQLLDPESNVSYAARELRALLDRRNRSPGISASALAQSPAVMALVITEYRSGRKPTDSSNIRVGANAIRTLRTMQDDTLAQFEDSGIDPVEIRALIGDYLERVRCESGMFNKTCEREASRLEPTEPSGI